jgi:hypothetical protein
VTSSGIFALREQRRRVMPQRERAPHERELHAAVAPVRQLLGRRAFFLAFGKPRAAFFEIDGTAVVRIDEAEIPQFRALIKIRHARRRQPEQSLLETVDRPGRRDACGEAGQFAQETVASLRRDDVGQEVAAGVLVSLVGREPARAQLRFAQRLQLPLRDAPGQFLHAGVVVGRQIRRPAADQRLIQHRFRSRTGRPAGVVIAADRAAQRRVQRRPVVQRRRPLLRNFAQCRDPRAHVFAALVVVRRGGEHRVGKRLRAFRVGFVKLADGQRELARIGAHFVARQEPPVPIARRVFHRLRRHRRGQLRKERLRAAPLRTARAGRVLLRRRVPFAVASALRRALARLLGDGRLVRQLAAEPLRNLIEHAVIRPRQHGARAFQRLREIPFVLGAAHGIDRIDPVHRKLHDEFANHAAQRRERQIAGRGRVAGDPVQRPRDAIQFRREVLRQDLAPRDERFVGESGAAAGEFAPGARERFGAARIVQQRAHVVHEVVAGRAVHLPVAAQGFAARQNLLDDEIRAPVAVLQRGRPLVREFFQPLAQALAILARLGEAIDVIDSHAVDQSFAEEPEDQRMRCLEHFRPLGAHATERADVEKAPPVDFVGGGAPPREPEMLALQQPVQALAALRRIGGMRGERRRDRGLSALGRGERDERGARVGGAGLVGGLGREAREALREFGRFLKNRRIVDRADRKRVRVVLDHETPFIGLERELDLAALQLLAVGRAEKRREHLAAQRRIGRMPVHVEKARVRRVAAPFENIEPPRVFRAADAHVIRHHVDDQPHFVRAQLVHEAPQRLLAAEFRVHARVVHGVVAVRRAARRGRDRRRVGVADPERGEVVDLGGGVVEGEALVKLQPERGARYGHGVSFGGGFDAERPRALSTASSRSANASSRNSSSTGAAIRRRQFGCSSIEPGRFGCSASASRSSSG